MIVRKAFALIWVLSVSIVAVFSGGSPETSAPMSVRMAVMQGPTGFSASELDNFVELSVYPSPNEAVAKIINGELDMVVLPANNVAVLYNKGVDIRAVAVVGEGMLSIVGNGKIDGSLSVPGAGGTPDHMAQLLFSEYQADYSVAAPAQLAQLLISGKKNLAILPQPFVSMVLAGNSSLGIIADVQSEWEKLTGNKQYPMSILVVSSAFADSYPELVKKVKDSYRSSVEKVLSDPKSAGKKIEELGIMKAELAVPALDKCAIVFKDGNEAGKEVADYYKVLLDLAPAAIGGKLPEGRFWN